jgi:hypothetical protein
MNKAYERKEMFISEYDGNLLQSGILRFLHTADHLHSCLSVNFVIGMKLSFSLCKWWPGCSVTLP